MYNYKKHCGKEQAQELILIGSVYWECLCIEECLRVCAFTKHSSHKSKREVWRKGSEEPGSGVETRADLVLLQMSVQLPVIVMQQTRQLIHLNLRKKEEKKSYWKYQSEEYKKMPDKILLSFN